MNPIKLVVAVLLVLLVVAGGFIIFDFGPAKTSLPEVTEANCKNDMLVQSIQDLDARQKFREYCQNEIFDAIAHRVPANPDRPRRAKTW